MGVPTQETTIAADGQALFTSAFQSKPVLAGLLKSYLASVQDIENTLWTLINAMTLGTAPGNAFGVWLDYWGELVGQPRLSMDDTDFYTAIRLRIAANRSGGRAEDILQIGAAIANPSSSAHYVETYPAGFLIETPNINGALPVASVLSEAKDGGVRGVLHYTLWPDGSDFEWGSRYIATAGELGYGTVTDGRAHGGLLCAAAELTR